MSECKNLELLDQRVNEIAEDLGKTQIGSDAYDKRVLQLTEVNKVRESYCKTELQRSDMESKNAIALEEIDVKRQEVRNVKIRNRVTAITVCMYTAASIYTGKKAYTMGQESISFKPLELRSGKFLDKINPFTK